MIYCVNCEIDWTGVEMEKPGTCPKCQCEMRELSSPKLIDLMKEVNQVVQAMGDKNIQANPKQIIEMARIIEKGEKKFEKEFAKRLDQLKDIQYELTVITKFCDRMGYKLTADETEEEPA